MTDFGRSAYRKIPATHEDGKKLQENAIFKPRLHRKNNFKTILNNKNAANQPFLPKDSFLSLQHS